MAKAPGLAPVKSRLQPVVSAEDATELYRCFLLDRLDALAEVEGIERVVAFTPLEGEPAIRALAPPGFRLVPQRGADLGERLATLLGDLVVGGRGCAIAMDSDSPTLPMAYVGEAARVLGRDEADLVLGPCEDGGYYLIGVRAPQPALFDGIPWSTDRVLGLTLEKARALGLRTYLLPTWYDVDTEADLRRLHGDMDRAGGGPRRTFAFVNALYSPAETDRRRPAPR